MAWTNASTTDLIGQYKEGVIIPDLCVNFGRTKTSIINKLVREGVYIKPEKKVVQTKKMMVRAVKAKTGLDLPSMEKIDKKDFEALVIWLAGQCDHCIKKSVTDADRDSMVTRLLNDTL